MKRGDQLESCAQAFRAEPFGEKQAGGCSPLHFRGSVRRRAARVRPYRLDFAQQGGKLRRLVGDSMKAKPLERRCVEPFVPVPRLVVQSLSTARHQRSLGPCGGSTQGQRVQSRQLCSGGEVEDDGERRSGVVSFRL
jgi:hypothetical protein